MEQILIEQCDISADENLKIRYDSEWLSITMNFHVRISHVHKAIVIIGLKIDSELLIILPLCGNLVEFHK